MFLLQKKVAIIFIHKANIYFYTGLTHVIYIFGGNSTIHSTVYGLTEELKRTSHHTRHTDCKNMNISAERHRKKKKKKKPSNMPLVVFPMIQVRTTYA